MGDSRFIVVGRRAKVFLKQRGRFTLPVRVGRSVLYRARPPPFDGTRSALIYSSLSTPGGWRGFCGSAARVGAGPESVAAQLSPRVLLNQAWGRIRVGHQNIFEPERPAAAFCWACSSHTAWFASAWPKNSAIAQPGSPPIFSHHRFRGHEADVLQPPGQNPLRLAVASPATVFPREQKDNQDKLALRESSDFTICFQKGKHKTSREHHFCFDVNLVNIIKASLLGSLQIQLLPFLSMFF